MGLCIIFCMLRLFFFFKQKTAYEMRISDWSSDVCSSDLEVPREGVGIGRYRRRAVEGHRLADERTDVLLTDGCDGVEVLPDVHPLGDLAEVLTIGDVDRHGVLARLRERVAHIGRGSFRERRCSSV